MRMRREFLLLLPLCLCLICCGDNATSPDPPEAPAPQAIQTGAWSASTAFGTFTFEVGSSGSTITKITITYSNWKGRSGSISQTKDPAWEISSRNFSINTTINGEPWVLTGNFKINGIEATGTWKVTIGGSDESGSWEASPNG
jgi:hypothetical protein